MIIEEESKDDSSSALVKKFIDNESGIIDIALMLNNQMM